MKNKNLILLAVLAIAIAAVALAAKLLPRRVDTLPEGLAAPTAAPEETQPSGTDAAPDDQPTPVPARGYVLVSTNSASRWIPLPESGEEAFAVRQTINGEEVENVIHLTPDGVYMESSTCEGQDCVQQGEVTLENRSERILANFIVCLPQQVTIELYTPEEILQMAAQTRKEAAQ